MITAVQKQKHTEEESSRKVHELESEIASSRESQEALERKVREFFFFFCFRRICFSFQDMWMNQ